MAENAQGLRSQVSPPGAETSQGAEGLGSCFGPAPLRLLSPPEQGQLRLEWLRRLTRLRAPRKLANHLSQPRPNTRILLV